MMRAREPLTASSRWVLGGIALAVSAMVSASAPYVQQVAVVPLYSAIGTAALVAALLLFVVDAGSVDGVLSDRPTAWTGTMLIAIAMIGLEIFRAFLVVPRDFLIPSAMVLLNGAALVGLGVLAWAGGTTGYVRRDS